MIKMLYIYKTKCDTCQTQNCETCKENIDGTFSMEEINKLLEETK